jgi:hypothetical protein
MTVNNVGTAENFRPPVQLSLIDAALSGPNDRLGPSAVRGADPSGGVFAIMARGETPKRVAVDLGEGPVFWRGMLMSGGQNGFARVVAKEAGYSIERNNRTLWLPNDRKGGQMFADLQFKPVRSEVCDFGCREVYFRNGELSVPQFASQEFKNGFKERKALYEGRQGQGASKNP